jgi:signal transduction histidine kinase/ABC-type amino acid transport substrate-binding protein
MIFANQNLRIHFLIAITFWLLAGNTLANFEKQSNSDVDVKKIAEQISKKIQVSETEQKWINANHSIRYWVSTEAPPYFYDKKQPVGLAIDYAKIVCATYKLNCEFKDRFKKTFSESIPFVGTESGPDAFMTGRFLPERLNYVLYTQKYLFSPWVIITRADNKSILTLQDLVDKKIIGVKGFVVNGMVKKDVSNFEFIEKRTQLDALEALSSGVGDAYVADLVNATFMIAQYGLSNLKVAAPTGYPIQGESMMIRKDWPELVSLTDKVFDSLTGQDKQNLKTKWFSVRFDYGGWQTYSIYASLVLGALFISLLLFVFWNKKLKKDKAKIQALLNERQTMIKTLLKANKTAATGALSAAIAHELNQPLGASNINIQFLKSKLDKGQLNLELCTEILNALQFDNQRAANIVRSLRSIFIENDLDTSKVNVNAIILTILDIVKPELKEKNIQIEYHVDPCLEIQITSSELRQVILNLVNNAIQALGNSATINPLIWIDVSRHSGTVQIVTTDNGPGISKENQANLFEILISTKQSGMGLGLWLCQYMITRHGGSIYYEDALGGGARFVIEIPHSA